MPIATYVNILPNVNIIPDLSDLRGLSILLEMYPMAATLAAKAHGEIAVANPMKNADMGGIEELKASCSIIPSVIVYSPDNL
jgi:hypothetical protein